jgi:hypothetical protein
MMQNLYQEIPLCLGYFGPCNASQIAAKLAMRGIVVSRAAIVKELAFLLERKRIRLADGFEAVTYKL